MKADISTRLTLVGVASLAAVLIVAAVGIKSVRDLERLGAELYSEGLAEMTLATDLAVSFNQQESHVHAATIQTDQSILVAERLEVAGQLSEMRAQVQAYATSRDDPLVAESHKILLEALDIYEIEAMKVFDLAMDSAFAESVDQLNGPTDDAGHIVTMHLHTIIDRSRRHAESLVGEMGESQDLLLLNVLLVSIGLVLLLGVTAYFVVFRGVTLPIRDMTVVMRRLADGDKSVDIPATDNSDEIGDMARAVAVFRENMIEAERVADERRAERQERERQQARTVAERTRFFTAAGHDLRQPLHAISLYLPVLESRAKDDKDRELIGAIGRSCDAMVALVDSLLEISRLDAGEVKPRIAPVPIVDIFDQLEVEFAPQTAAKSLELRIEPVAAWVATDQPLLLRMLRNLLVNAVSYTREGWVGLSAHEDGSRLVVEVADSGIGIPEHEQPYVFNEFYQVDNPGRDRDQGLGLGLSIIHRLSRLLGHRIDLESSPGAGTVFRLALPLTNPPAQEAAPENAPPAADLSGRLAVLVEDDNAVREAAEFLLADWGCEVIAAGATAAAVEAVTASGRIPDFIVADLRLPRRETGVHAIDRIRRAVGAPVPALVVTGDTDPARLQEVAQSELTLLHKPLRAGQFRLAVEALLFGRVEAGNRETADYADT